MSVEVPLSPKFQVHDVGELVEVSVNMTVSGLVPEVGEALKLATGAPALTVMKFVLVRVLLPAEFVAFSVTV